MLVPSPVLKCARRERRGCKHELFQVRPAAFSSPFFPPLLPPPSPPCIPPKLMTAATAVRTDRSSRFQGALRVTGGGGGAPGGGRRGCARRRGDRGRGGRLLPPPSPSRPQHSAAAGAARPLPHLPPSGGGVGITLIPVNPERLRSEEGAEGIRRKNPQLAYPPHPPPTPRTAVSGVELGALGRSGERGFAWEKSTSSGFPPGVRGDRRNGV